MANLKVGSKVLINGDPFEIMKLEHVKTGRGGATDKCIARNILTGSTIGHSFHDINQVEMADVRSVNGEYLYGDGEDYYFMNTETYDQFSIGREKMGDTTKLIVDGCKVIIQEYNGTPINVTLEASVELEVESTPPGEKWDTATGGKKPATLVTGLVVQVPLFINPGDMIKVDTRTLDYLSRV